MKEQELIKSIQSVIGTNYLGDDCAYLKDIGIVVTQDSLSEGVHFKKDWYIPYELGYKSVAVNISDVLASGAKPVYVTIALSLPDDIDISYIKNFYEGAQNALYGAKIVGGDITGSSSGIVISITAIGSTKDRKISSRKNAKPGYVVVVKGNHGSSAAGLNELLCGRNNAELIIAHKKPELEEEFSKYIAQNSSSEYAMMDTSDGLADALFKIAEASNVKIKIDYEKIPHLNCVSQNYVLFGGEDYKLVASVPKELALQSGGTIIGEVFDYDGVRLDISGREYNSYSELNTFDHFKNGSI